MTAIGRRAYALRATGLSWPAIAAEVYGVETPTRAQWESARSCAKTYALRRSKPLPWPPVGSVVHTERRGKLDGADLTRPTRELRVAYGVSTEAVSKARERHGITEWDRRRPTRAPKPCLAPVARPKPAPAPKVTPAPVVAPEPATTREQRALDLLLGGDAPWMVAILTGLDEATVERMSHEIHARAAK